MLYLEGCYTMPIRNSNWLNQKRLWRVVGFISSITGLLSYAMSSSFKHLFGEWNLSKIMVYTVVSCSISSMMLFLKKWKLSRSFLLKAQVGVLVLLLTSLYSFFSDKAGNGKPDMLSMISSASFALMSLSLSRQIDLGFEADLLNFFLGCLTVQLMEVNLLLSIVAAIICYLLMILRSKLESQSQVGALRMQDHVTVEMGAEHGVERGDDDNSHQQIPLLRRRVVDDGYNWRKYEEKLLKSSGTQRSYYRCTYTKCPGKKEVERTIDGEIVDILCKGTHTHHKPNLTIKWNSSSELLYSLLPSEPEIPDQPFASKEGRQLNHDEAPESSSISI